MGRVLAQQQRRALGAQPSLALVHRGRLGGGRLLRPPRRLRLGARELRHHRLARRVAAAQHGAQPLRLGVQPLVLDARRLVRLVHALQLRRRRADRRLLGLDGAAQLLGLEVRLAHRHLRRGERRAQLARVARLLGRRVACLRRLARLLARRVLLPLALVLQ